MSLKVKTIIAAMGLFLVVACGVWLGHALFVPPLKRDLAEAKEKAAIFEARVIGLTAEAIARSASVSGSALQSREESHAQVQTASVQAQVAVSAARQQGIDIDAVLPAELTDPVVGMYCQAARAVDCAGGNCRQSAATGLCIQANVGAQVTLTARELAAALINCSKWTGEAGPDRYVIEQHAQAMKEYEAMGKSE